VAKEYLEMMYNLGCEYEYYETFRSLRCQEEKEERLYMAWRQNRIKLNIKGYCEKQYLFLI
jgi:hypothetical protein